MKEISEMRLQCEKYCNECKKETLQEWVGLDNHGMWIMECLECGTSYCEHDPIVHWLKENKKK